MICLNISWQPKNIKFFAGYDRFQFPDATDQNATGEDECRPVFKGVLYRSVFSGPAKAAGETPPAAWTSNLQ
jgi:hypothetical protein